MLAHQLNHCTLFYSISWYCLWKLSFYTVFQRLVWNTECQKLQPLNVINRRVHDPSQARWGKATLWLVPSHLLLLASGCIWPRQSSWTPFKQKTGRPAWAHLSSVESSASKSPFGQCQKPRCDTTTAGDAPQLSADWITNTQTTRDQCAKLSPNSITFSI